MGCPAASTPRVLLTAGKPRGSTKQQKTGCQWVPAIRGVNHVAKFCLKGRLKVAAVSKSDWEALAWLSPAHESVLSPPLELSGFS